MKIEIDYDAGEITYDGIRFTFEVFDAHCKDTPPGIFFRFSREDDLCVVQQIKVDDDLFDFIMERSK